MTCPACGAANRDAARFCKGCGARLDAPRVPPPSAPSAGPLPPPPALRPRAWWHPIGVAAIVATFLAFVDAASDGQASWSLVAIPGLGFLAGGLLIVQFLASAARADRRPFFAGAALLVAAVFLLPVSVAVQGRGPTAETVEVPFDPAIRNLNLDVSSDAGEVSVTFPADAPYLVRAEIVHAGGVLSSHFDGDVAVTNSTTGDTLAFRVTARGVPGLFFVGGHHVRVSVHRNVSAAIALDSTSGTLSVDVPPGVAIRGIDATVTTGPIGVSVRDAAWANGAGVRLASTTGAVTVDLLQTTAGEGTASVDAASTAGRVLLRFDGAPGVGAEISTSAPPGAVAVDPAKYEGSSGLLYAPSRDGFLAASLKFIVQLRSTTGSVAAL